MWVGLAAAALPVTAGFCFLAYRLFMAFVVIKTGGTDGLKDVPTAMPAYRAPLLSRTAGNAPARNSALKDAGAERIWSEQASGAGCPGVKLT